MKMSHSVLLIIACCFVTGVATYLFAKRNYEEQIEFCDRLFKDKDKVIKIYEKSMMPSEAAIDSLSYRLHEAESGNQFRLQEIEKQTQQINQLKYYLIHPDEFDILCRTVSGESGGQSQACQQMVAETIMNKTDKDAVSRGNAIRSVVYAPNAFVVADCLNKFEPSEITRNACIDAILSNKKTSALYFCSASIDDADFQIRFIKPLEKVAEIDGMKFWRLKE